MGPAARVVRLLLAALLVLAAVGCVHSSAPAPTTATFGPPACPLGAARCPDPRVTPGMLLTDTSGVCSAGYNPRGELDKQQKQALLRAYWPTGLPAGVYVVEWDHLIGRWAGGASAPANIWPMTDRTDVTRKDHLERVLYEAVCQQRKVGLADAQQRMRQFWRFW